MKTTVTKTTTPSERTAEKGEMVLVVRRHPGSGTLTTDHLTWGLIPHDAVARPDIQPHHARAETISEKPMFRLAYRRRRCVVPVDAFNQKDVHGKRRTVRRADGEPLAIAGIWENWRDPASGRWIRTFATLTVASNAVIAAIHDRMPLVLEKQDLQRWLGTEDDPRDLLRPSADDILCVSPRTGNRSQRS